MPETADEALAEARRLHAAGDVAGGHEVAMQALTLDPNHVGALEFLATALVARRRQYQEGLALIDRAVAAAPDDAGVWYARGWCYEFAAHELQRRPNKDSTLAPVALFTTAAESFHRCLALNPDGKLLDDAEDLLEHVENELSR